ncbi:hypothetical protein BGZ63DRAFT_376331 [Mariannaea sp. PMI_226]|nr:hypothetical protein BGZ63DRAFT_376331 [Mariannaea sp. PMI_226]
MFKPSLLLSAFSMLALGRLALAEGCSTHSFTSCADGIVHWFDPDTGQVCDPIDCGGGRAPPKTNVPGCAGYTGTEVPTTSYLSCWKPSATKALSSAAESTTDIQTTSEKSTKTAAGAVTKTEPETTQTNAVHSSTDDKEHTSGLQQSEVSTTSAAKLSTAQNPTTHSSTPSSTSTPNAGNSMYGSLISASLPVVVAGVLIFT